MGFASLLPITHFTGKTTADQHVHVCTWCHLMPILDRMAKNQTVKTLKKTRKSQLMLGSNPCGPLFFERHRTLPTKSEGTHNALLKLWLSKTWIFFTLNYFYIYISRLFWYTIVQNYFKKIKKHFNVIFNKISIITLSKIPLKY